MKKVFFVSAIMCMAMAAFVACSKNDGNDPGGNGGNGGSGNGGGMCTCYALGQKLGDFESGQLTCAQLAEASTQASGYTVTCSPK